MGGNSIIASYHHTLTLLILYSWGGVALTSWHEILLIKQCYSDGEHQANEGMHSLYTHLQKYLNHSIRLPAFLVDHDKQILAKVRFSLLNVLSILSSESCLVLMALFLSHISVNMCESGTWCQLYFEVKMNWSILKVCGTNKTKVVLYA